MLLAIDTSTRNAGVALAREGQVISSRSWRSAVNHTSELMPAAAQLLQTAGMTAHDLDGIAVALGPGGFSALRVGMSVAKGLAMATGKPLVGIGTLDAEAQPCLQSGLPVCALLDAGRSEVSSAHFAPDGQRLREDLICPLHEMVQGVEEATIFCGEAVVANAALIKETLGTRAIVLGHSPAIPTVGSRRVGATAAGGRR